jgi:hypothetical protein
MAFLREGSAPLECYIVKIVTATMVLGIVAIVGYYLTAAFIVHQTGTTAGVLDLAHGAALILRALLGLEGPGE